MSKLKTTQLTLYMLIALSCLTVIVYIFPNLQGTDDLAMLSMKSLDEYAQYGSLIAILSPDGSWMQTLSAAIHYNYYYYGYVFFLVSALAVLPGHVLGWLGVHMNITQVDLLILRELSVLFMLGAIWILIYMFTGFKRFWPAVLTFLFLETLPGVVANNLWWHPESLTIFLIVLTLFALQRDLLRFKKWFYLAAIFCGLAIGTKFIGVFFCLVIPIYLFYGLLTKRLSVWRTIGMGLLFCVLMGLTLLITNPLLGTRSGFNTYYSLLQFNSEHMKAGWNVQQNAGLGLWYSTVLRPNFAYAWTILGVIIIAIGGIFQKKRLKIRIGALVVLVWSLTYGGYIVFSIASKLSKYILPAMVPLLGLIALGYMMIFAGLTIVRHRVTYFLSLAGLVLMTTSQLWILPNVVTAYHRELTWEQSNPGITFYHGFHDAVSLDDSQPLTIYHDWGIYLPDSTLGNSKVKFGIVNYNDVTAWLPDYILLERAPISDYAHDPSRFVDVAEANIAQPFYQDVEANAVQGYVQVYSDAFGIAFKKITL